MSEWSADDSGLTLAQIETKQPYRFEPHAFVTRRRITWPVCRRCGLVLLRNDLTDWCVKRGCDANNHPEFRAACARLSGQRRAA